jgi:hypothetical protein
MRPLIRERAYSRHAASLLLAFGACVALLGGCAAPATYQGMVPTSPDVSKRHPQTVSVEVRGGKETAALGTPQISDAAFAQALAESIARSQLFSRVVQGPGGSHLLSVVLFSMEQPSFGFSLTVKIEAGWTLKRTDTGATVWQESIRSQYTAPGSEGLVAAERLRLATEGAARNNISEGLARISKLSL